MNKLTEQLIMYSTELPVYIIPGNNELFHFLFRDVKDRANVYILKSLFKLEISHKWQLRIRKRFGTFFDFLCTFLFLPINPVLCNPGIIIFSNISVPNVNIIYLKYLQKKGYKIVLFFLDSISNNDNAIEAYEYTKQFSFDLVYTYDQGDATRNGFIFYPTMYPSISLGSGKTNYDFCFIGSNKGRVLEIEKLKSKYPDLKSFISVHQLDIDQMRKIGIQSNKPIPYEDILAIDSESNVILDIVAGEGQTGLSLRPYEAVVLNKKLATNNPSIIEFDYYDSRFMIFFKEIQDIPKEFFTNIGAVDYHYKGEYSSVFFLERILKDISV